MTSLIIIDFDGVLLNDQKFKKDYIRLFKTFGIPVSLYESAYRELKNKKGFYDPEAHIAILQKKKPGLKKDGLIKKINSFVKNSSRYIYKDAIPFLKFFKKRRYDLVLLSTGHEYQNLKIKNSKIIHFFKEIIIIPNFSKTESVAKILKNYLGKPSVFIDDKKEVVDEVKKEIPNIYIIQLARRKYQIRSKIVSKVLSNLSQVKALLKHLKI